LIDVERESIGKDLTSGTLKLLQDEVED